MAILNDNHPFEDRVPPGITTDAAAPSYGCHISLTRILVLSIVSMGLYWFYWMYLTWKQYRDHTGATAYPVWHALTQLVPIYVWFRFYAHGRAYKNLMEEIGVANSLHMAPIMIITIIATAVENRITIFWLKESFGGDGISVANELALDIVSWIAIAVSAVILCWIQSNINRYWAAYDASVIRSARIGKGEVILAIIGVILWILTIIYYLFPV